jgi:hypothetical protein
MSRHCDGDCCLLRHHDEHKCRVRASFYRMGTYSLLLTLLLIGGLL